MATDRRGRSAVLGSSARSEATGVVRALRALRALFVAVPLVVGASSSGLAASGAVVEGIRVTLAETGVAIELSVIGDRSGATTSLLRDPARLVVDLPGARSELPTHRLDLATPDVARVRVAQHADKVRVVLDGGSGPGRLDGARLVETERGIVLVVGDVPLPGDASHPVASPTSDPAGALDALREAGAAIREAASELRGALSSRPPQPVAESVPTTPERRASADERSQPPEPAPEIARRPTPQPAPEIARRPTPQPAPEATPRPSPGPDAEATARTAAEPATYAGVTYQTVVDWISRYRDARPSFQPGEVIHRADIERLRPFYPPGYFEELLFDDVEIEIQATVDFRPHASYAQATLQYGGQTRLAPDGSILDYVAGLPFPEERILSARPRDGGFMVAWNNIYRWSGGGWRSDDIPMVYLVPGDGSTREAALADVLQGGGHVERSVAMEYHRVYLSHLAHYASQGHRIQVADSNEQHFKDWIQFSEPFDMRGMAFVFERFRDPHEPDQVNSYLPTERRVRRLSAKERADSFVGSEMTMDDFEGFSGRVLDYEWSYVGQKSVMHVQDSKWERSRYQGPQSHIPLDQWQVRRCHVVESRPLYPGHPYGRKLTFFDAQTFNIAANVIFDHEDRLLKVIYTIYNWPGGSPDGVPEATVTEWRGSTVFNLQNHRSLVSWGNGVEIPTMTASKVRRLFSVSNLTGGR